MRTLYTAVSTAHGGRDGHVHSSDGIIDLDLKTPKEMGGPGGAGTNPEQLFASGYAACFESAMRAVARKQKKPLTDASVTGHVSFNVTDDGKYVLSVELHGAVEGFSPEDTTALMQAAHEVCPYSNATRGNISVKLVAAPKGGG
jgi:osmotically inducible protein OsmC